MIADYLDFVWKNRGGKVSSDAPAPSDAAQGILGQEIRGSTNALYQKGVEYG
jgi:hypothetical protein